MDRIDALLDKYLETGELPADVTAAERAELEELISAAAVLRSERTAIDREAGEVMPIARARFERHMQAARTPSAQAENVPRSAWDRPGVRLGRFRMAGLALAGLAAVAAIAFTANQVIFQSATSVSALEPGDYAQVEGVVTSSVGEGDERLLRVETAIGEIVVEAGAATSVVDQEDAAGLDALRPGVAVLVAGLVQQDRRIAAQTLAISATDPDTPVRSALRRFRAADIGLVGSIVSVSLAADGSHALVVLEGEGGRQFVVEVEERTAARLLAARRAIGLRVRVVQVSGGVYAFEAVNAEPTPSATQDSGATVPPGRPDGDPGEAPSLVAIEGVVLSAGEGRLVVLTLRGRVQVDVLETTRILPGESGLTVEQVREGQPLVGHVVVVRGGLDADSGRVRADVLIAGRETERGR